MTELLFEKLEQAGFALDPLNIGDAFWLAQFVSCPSNVISEPASENDAMAENPQQPMKRSASETRELEERGSQNTDKQKEPPADEDRDPPASPDSHIYAEQSPDSRTKTVPASPIRVPTASALPHWLDLARALRPLNVRRPSTRRFEFDEQETVERAARQRNLLTPVFRPRMERRFKAVLVVEQSPSMDLWGQAIREFHKLLERQGAFEDVRMWRLLPDEKCLVTDSGRRMPPELLADPSGNSIIFYVTTGLAPNWRTGELGSIFTGWGRKSPLVMVHALPPDLWKRTALRFPTAVTWAERPGQPNSTLKWDSEVRPRADENRFVAPVMHWTVEEFGRWAQMVMARGRSPMPAYLVRTVPFPRQTLQSREISGDGNVPIELALDSLDHSSPEARELAVHLAAAPLTLPVIRLVQAALFEDRSRPSQIAEVMLGGLVQRVTPDNPPVHPDTVQYRFDPRALPLLLERLRKSSALSLVDLLTPYIRDHKGNIVDFRALVRDSNGKFELPETTQPFAELVVGLVKTLGFMPDRSVHREQPRQKVVLRGHTQVVNAVWIGHDRLVISAGSDGTIRRWDPETGRQTGMTHYPHPVTALTSSSGGRIVAGAGHSSIVLEIAGQPSNARDLLIKFDSHHVTALTMDEGGNVVSGHGDGTLRRFDGTGKTIEIIAKLPSMVVSVATTADGQFVVAATDQLVSVFRNGQGVTSFTSAGRITGISIDRLEGKWFAVTIEGSGVEIHSVETKRITRTIPEITKAVMFTPDGRYAAGVRGLNELIVWDVERNREVQTFSGHDLAVETVAISADGSTIVSGGWDKTVRVWRITPRQAPGRIALLVHERTSGEAAQLTAVLQEQGYEVHPTVLPSTGFLTQVDAAEAIIFVEPDVANPYVLGALKYTGKPLLEFTTGIPGNSELVQGAAKLIAEARNAGPLSGVPALPGNYFPRPRLEDELTQLLLDNQQTAIQLEGIGRTMLLNAVARSDRVRKHFLGGIIWRDVAPGMPAPRESPTLYCIPTLWNPPPGGIPDAPPNVVTALRGRPREGAGARTIFSVPPLSREECSEFLSRNLSPDAVVNFDLLYEMHRAEWPLLIRLDALARICEPEALVTLLVNVAGRRRGFWETYTAVTLPVMRPEARAFLEALSMFFGTRVPRTLVKPFLHDSSLIDDLSAAGFISKEGDTAVGTSAIPAEARSEPTAEFHRRVVQIYAESGVPVSIRQDDGYYFQNLIGHMIGAGMRPEAEQLVARMDWQQKISELLGPHAVAEQLRLAGRAANVQRPTGIGGFVLVATARNKPDDLRRIAWSPDGKLLASASYDGIVRVWSSDDFFRPPKVVRVLIGHSDRCYGVSWSPDSSRLASASRDGSVIIWGISQSEWIRVFRGDGEPILSVAWSPVGNRIAAGSDSGTLYTWNLEGSELGRGRGTSSIHSVVWMQNGKGLLSGANDGFVSMWATGGGQPVRQMEHGGEVYGVAISPDGGTIASAGNRGAIRLWTTEGKSIAELRGHQGNVTDIAFSPGSELLASISWDNSIGIWDTGSFEMTASIPATSSRRFHSGLAFQPGSGNLLAGVAERGSQIGFWVPGGYTKPFAVNSPESGIDAARRVFEDPPDQKRGIENALKMLDGFARSGYVQLFLHRNSRLMLESALLDEGKGGYGEASLEGIIGRAFRTGLSVWVPDVNADESYIAAEASTRSELAIPVKVADSSTLLGVINLEFTEINAVTERELAWIQEFTGALANYLSTPNAGGSARSGPRAEALRPDVENPTQAEKPQPLGTTDVFEPSGLLAPEKALAYIRESLKKGNNVIVGGPAGAGKTAILKALEANKAALRAEGFSDVFPIAAPSLDSGNSRSVGLRSIFDRLARSFQAESPRVVLVDDMEPELVSSFDESWRQLQKSESRGNYVQQYVVATSFAKEVAALITGGGQQVTIVALSVLNSWKATNLVRKLADRCEAPLSQKYDPFPRGSQYSWGEVASVAIRIVRDRIGETAPEHGITDDGFHTAAGIRQFIMHYLPNDDLVIDTLLVFKTNTQRTWLASSLHEIFCVLDDGKVRARDRLIQWRQPLDAGLKVAVRSGEDGDPVFDIGRSTDWLYTKKLHPKRRSFTAKLRRISSPNNLA